MIITQSLVKELLEPMRILDYVVLHMESVLPSKSSVKKAFKKELILLNGTIAQTGNWISKGDVIELMSDESACFKVFPLVLDLVYEDQFIAVINKPAGFSVSGNYFKTIQNALPFNLNPSIEEDALKIPRPVHRLDKLTAGLLLVAKTKKAQIGLGMQFEKQVLTKTYYALVKGAIEQEGVFTNPINGQDALSHYENVRTEKSLSYDWVSLVKLRPKTGRTHQLRIHLASNGNPIIGDYIYDEDNVLKGKGLFLCAQKIEFTHPITLKIMSFEVKVPSKFESFFERELRRWKKFKS